MLRRWRALAFVPVAAMLVTGPVFAQEGTPTADDESPRLVNPEECVAEPRPYEEIATILDIEGAGVPQPPTTQITPPLGEIVDFDTELAIEEAARGVIA
ncbi:MAG: hypothetical protein ACRDJC_24070, partial [Thermomicrobiales bacterium]